MNNPKTILMLNKPNAGNPKTILMLTHLKTVPIDEKP